MAKKNNNQNQVRSSAVARHAEYTETQKHIESSFGIAFKTGGHRTDKRDVSRKREKQNLMKEFAY